MRTKENTITIPTRLVRGWFRHIASGADLCSGAVRRAFDLDGARSVDFKITNIKPKNLSGWHVLKKTRLGIWELTTGSEPHYVGLMRPAGRLITMNFPKNTRVYVSAYG
jgi:hypothetical protein